MKLLTKLYDRISKMRDMSGATVGQSPVKQADGTFAPGNGPTDDVAFGSVSTADPGDGHRRIVLLPNTSMDIIPAGEYGLAIVGGELKAIINGALVSIGSTGPIFTPLAMDDFAGSIGDHFATISGQSAMQVVDGGAVGTSPSGLNGAYWVAAAPASWPDNQFARIVAGAGDGIGRQVYVRVNGANNYHASFNPTSVYLYKTISGVDTIIASTTLGGYAPGDTLELRVYNGVITALVNDVVAATAENTEVGSGAPGFGVWSNTTAPSDNFVAGSIT